MKGFRELLESDSVYVFDGAMGTRLYDKGIYINRSYDELNLVAADLVREVHEEYVRAGAKIARQAAGDRVYVAGAIGPLGVRIEPFGPTSFDEAKDIYKEQIEGL